MPRECSLPWRQGVHVGDGDGDVLVGRRWKRIENDTNLKSEEVLFFTKIWRIPNIQFQRLDPVDVEGMQPSPKARCSRWWWRWCCNCWEALKTNRKWYKLEKWGDEKMQNIRAKKRVQENDWIASGHGVFTLTDCVLTLLGTMLKGYGWWFGRDDGL